jgi:Uma2 family endonuclease
MPIDPVFLRAEELGIRLEVVGGLPIWEAHPVWRHQKAVDRIRATIKPNRDSQEACACVHASDVYVSFSDRSLKRPDVAIFCREPDEQEDAITLIPEAVIEVVSKGYEAKDLEIGPPFYLSRGVKDVIVFDPTSLLVLHARRDGTTRQVSPQVIDLECGCTVTV